ncbi:hypothetical protein Tco_0053169 [Tanacetum coccineum]
MHHLPPLSQPPAATAGFRPPPPRRRRKTFPAETKIVSHSPIYPIHQLTRLHAPAPPPPSTHRHCRCYPTTAYITTFISSSSSSSPRYHHPRHLLSITTTAPATTIRVRPVVILRPPQGQTGVFGSAVDAFGFGSNSPEKGAFGLSHSPEKGAFGFAYLY